MTIPLCGREELTLSQMKQMGKLVTYFTAEPLAGEGYESAKGRVFQEIEIFLKEHPGAVLYTGMHTESDWTKTYYWSKGAHLVNRSGGYAIIMPSTS